MDEKKNTKQWFALYVNVRHEKKIAQKMHEKGMECYVPLIKKMNTWSDRKKMVETPLIPGYAFVCLSPDEMDKPRFINGVVNYVRFNGKPATIRAMEIEGMKYFVDNGFGIEEVTGDELRIGDKVQFKLADFKSFVAVVEEFIGDNYALITFDGVAKNYKLKAAKKALRKR